MYENDARPDSTVQLRFARGPGSPTREVALFRQHSSTRCDDHLYVPIELRLVSDDGALDTTVVGVAEPLDHGATHWEAYWTQMQERGWIVELFPSNVEDQGLFLFGLTYADGQSDAVVGSIAAADLVAVAQLHGTVPSAAP